ncbi:MAG: hypothetical protein KC442_11865 [Thermomicrobiales bacterium]|nr:hypothetical protein [Thermomicrobiales bacterium]
MTWFAQLCLALLLATLLVMGAAATDVGMGGGVVLAICSTIAVLIVFRRR